MSIAVITELASRGTAAGDAVREGDVDAVRLAAHLVTDTLSCTAIGGEHPTVQRLLDSQRASTGALTPLAAPGRRRGEFDALVVDATAAHVDEFDVVHPRSGTVPGAVVVPAALQLGAAADVAGNDFLGAVLAGVEVTAAAGLWLGGAQLYQRSWWPGALAGRLGAAITTSHILGHQPPQVCNALALAATSVGGLLSEDVFADAHYVLLGDAAAAGVQAAYRAAAGLRGSTTLLDGPARRAFAGVEPLDEVDDGLHMWGTLVKEFPCATPLQAVIRALRALGGAALVSRARSIKIAIPSSTLTFISCDRVVDGPAEAAASLAHVVGAVASGREHDVAFFRAADPSLAPDCELTLGPTEVADVVDVTVTTVDGSTCTHREQLRTTEPTEQLLTRKLAGAFGPESPWLALPEEIAAGLRPRTLRRRLQEQS